MHLEKTHEVTAQLELKKLKLELKAKDREQKQEWEQKRRAEELADCQAEREEKRAQREHEAKMLEMRLQMMQGMPQRQGGPSGTVLDDFGMPVMANWRNGDGGNMGGL